MARTGILFPQVAHAAMKVIEDGKNPTVDNVREALGGTGSKSTIAPLLKRWKEEHQTAMAPMEPGVPPTLLHAVKGVYESMQNNVHEQLEQAREIHQAEMHTANERIEKQQLENIALLNDRAALAAALERATTTIERLQTENQSLNLTLAALHSDNTGMQQRLSDRAGEVNALNAQLTQSRTQFEHYHESIAAQRAQERQFAEQRIARLEQDLGNVRQQLSQQQTTVAQQAGHLAQLKAENKRAYETVRLAQEDVMMLRVEQGQLLYQVKETTTARDALHLTHENAQRELTAAGTQLAVQAKQNELLLERIVQAERQFESVTRENNALLQHQAMLQAELIQTKQRHDHSS